MNNRIRVGFRRAMLSGANSTGARGEKEAISFASPIHGFEAHVIGGEHQALILAVPNCHRESTTQIANEIQSANYVKPANLLSDRQF